MSLSGNQYCHRSSAIGWSSPIGDGVLIRAYLPNSPLVQSASCNNTIANKRPSLPTGAAHSSPSGTPAMISAAQFNASSSAGKHWVAIDGSVYDVSSWCHAHPGGQLVLLHSTARDASEAFHAYHPAWVRHRLPAFKIGQLATAPPLPGTSATAQPTTHSTKAEPTANKRMVDEVKSDRKGPQQYTGANADRLKQVQRALEAQGLFTTSAGFYSKLALSCLACLALAIWCVVHQYITLGALLLGLFWQQVCSAMQEMVSCMCACP